MHRRRLLCTVGSLGVAGLGGCLRLNGGETTTATSTARMTTADGDVGDADTTTAADEPASYPVGIDDDGVYALLVDNHVNTLVDATFTENWTSVNRTRGETTESMSVQVDDGHALMERGTGVDLQIYYHADGGFWREDLGSRETYGQDRRGYDVEWVTKSRDLRQLVVAGDWNAPTWTGGRYEITATGTQNPAGLEREYEATSIESFDATGFVTAEGILTELTVDFEFVHETEDRLYAVRVEHRVTDIGLSSVSEPSWYGTATNRAPQVDVRVDDANEYVVFEHRGGNPIEPDTNVVLYDRENRRNWGYRDNRDPFEAGDVVYLWMDQNDQLQWRRGSRPTTASPQSLDRQLAFWMHRHGAEYFGNVEL